MLRRSRRPALSLVSVALLATLAACGSEVVTAGDGPTEDGFDAFTVSGVLGSPPKISWKARMDVDKIEAKTLIEGDGPELAEGDQAVVDYTVGNGFSEQQTFTTYDEAYGSELVPVNDQAGPLFAEALAGHTVGSRIAVIATAEEAFGEQGNPQLGIGNEDTFVLVIDLASKAYPKPTGSRNETPAWVPEIVHEKGEPVRLDFAGTPEPTDALRVATLVAGEGSEVVKGDTIQVNYLGQVYGGDAPFDESFSKEPLETEIGAGKVVKGWDEGLVGQTVGSRVVLAIPPKLGYGEKGNEGAGITGTDTLYFVVDIVSAR